MVIYNALIGDELKSVVISNDKIVSVESNRNNRDIDAGGKRLIPKVQEQLLIYYSLEPQTKVIRLWFWFNYIQIQNSLYR